MTTVWRSSRGLRLVRTYARAAATWLRKTWSFRRAFAWARRSSVPLELPVSRLLSARAGRVSPSSPRAASSCAPACRSSTVRSTSRTRSCLRPRSPPSAATSSCCRSSPTTSGRTGTHSRAACRPTCSSRREASPSGRTISCARSRRSSASRRSSGASRSNPGSPSRSACATRRSSSGCPATRSLRSSAASCS